jgi:hypothetical protein
MSHTIGMRSRSDSFSQPRDLAFAHQADAPALDGKIVRRGADRPTLDEPRAADDAVGGAWAIRVRLAHVRGEKPDLVKAVRVEQQPEPGASVELSALLLAREPRLSSHLLRFGAPPLQLLGFVAHRHARPRQFATAIF